MCREIKKKSRSHVLGLIPYFSGFSSLGSEKIYYFKTSDRYRFKKENACEGQMLQKEMKMWIFLKKQQEMLKPIHSY